MATPKSKFNERDQRNIWLWVAGDGSVEDLAETFGVSVQVIKAEVMRQIRVIWKKKLDKSSKLT